MRLLLLCTVLASAHGLVPTDTSRSVVFRLKAKLDAKPVFGTSSHQLVAAKAIATKPDSDKVLVGLLAVVGGVLIHLACGTMYTWGNLVSYLPPHLKYWSGATGAGAGGGGVADAQLVLPIILVSQMAGMPFGPVLESLLGPALTAALGGVMMAAGTFAASYATTLSSFVSLYSVLFGLGVGIAYQMPFIVGARWFPAKKGMVTGAIISGMGASAFLFNLLDTSIVNPLGLNMEGGSFPPAVYARWAPLLRKLGLIYGALALTGALLQRNPPSHAPADYSIFGNAAGRFFWGGISDVAGFKRPFVVLTLLQSATMLSFVALARSRVTFALATVVMLFCMGGNFAMFPAQTMREFGANGAKVYSFLFTGFGSAALMGPLLSNYLLSKGGYELLYTTLGGLSLVSTALAAATF